MDAYTTPWTRARLLKAMDKKFPGNTFRKGEDFDSGYKGQIWTGEDAFDKDGINLFNYYPTYGLWDDCGVRTQLAELLEKAGWRAECHDPGTYFLTDD